MERETKISDIQSDESKESKLHKKYRKNYHELDTQGTVFSFFAPQPEHSKPQQPIIQLDDTQKNSLK